MEGYHEARHGVETGKDLGLRFVIPHLRDDLLAAEAEWERYLRDTPAPRGSRRVYSVTYEHEDSRIVATVGEERLEYRRKRGPRGGYIKNADFTLLDNGRVLRSQKSSTLGTCCTSGAMALRFGVGPTRP